MLTASLFSILSGVYKKSEILLAASDVGTATLEVRSIGHQETIRWLDV